MNNLPKASAKISAIVPVFNQVDKLERAVLSALGQSLPPDEVIIIDDGSVPSSAAKIQAICAAHSLRLLRHEVNKGVSQARNTGIMAASSEWIALLDADDYWEVDFLQSTVQVALNYSAGLVGTVYRYRHINGGITEAIIKPAGSQQSQGDVFRVDDYFQYALSGDVPFFSSAVLLSRNTMIECGLFDCSLSMGEDQVFWQRVIQSGVPCFVLNRPLSNYDISGAESACNSSARAAAWAFVKQIHQNSLHDPSPYRQAFIDRNALKAFVNAMHYKRYAMAREISQSDIFSSRFNRLLMRAMLLSKGWSSALIVMLYRNFSKRYKRAPKANNKSG